MVLFAISCKDEETVYVPSKEVVYDTVGVNSVRTTTIMTYDTIRKVVVDTIRYYTDSTVVNYDTVRTYTTDTIVVNKYDTIRTYLTINNYDTIRTYRTITDTIWNYQTITNYDTIRSYRTVTDTVRTYQTITDTTTVIVYDTIRNVEITAKYDTIKTYEHIINYDTILNHQTIYHYDTVRIEIYDTLSVILNPDGTLENQSWVIYFSNTTPQSVDSVKVKNDEILTLKTDIERAGYDLLYWNTQADGKGTSYKPGDELTINKHIILYAIWQSRTGVRVSELFDYLRNNYSSTMTIKIIDLNPDVKSIVSAIDKFNGLVNSINLDLSDAIALETLDESTFKDWKTLYSIKLPQNLKTIDHAFDGCSNLSSITIPENVETLNISNCAFSEITVPQQVRSLSITNCVNLTSISFATESLLETFKCNYCPQLTSISIPNSVSKFDGLAGCSRIEKCFIPSNVKEMYMDFEGCTYLNTLIHNLDKCSGANFKNCTNLKSISIPEGCAEITDSAFYGCTKLSAVDIPESVVKVGKYAFMNCSNLTSIKLPEKVSCIENCTLKNCTKLTSVIMPDSLQTIGNQVFANCTSLNTVSIPEKVIVIGDSAFFNCSTLASISLPEGITSINDHTFNGCNNLSAITIPETVTRIGDYAFCYCYNLSSIEIPENMLSIGDHSFYGCSGINAITIPNKVATIGNYAFYDCSNLSSITMENENPPTVGNNFIRQYSSGGWYSYYYYKTTIYVPETSVDTYNNADNWNTYSSVIVSQ